VVKVETNHCGCEELVIEQGGVRYNISDRPAPGSWEENIKSFAHGSVPREVELMIPFEAITIEPFVQYQNFERVVGDFRPNYNTQVPKIVNGKSSIVTML